MRAIAEDINWDLSKLTHGSPNEKIANFSKLNSLLFFSTKLAIPLGKKIQDWPPTFCFWFALHKSYLVPPNIKLSELLSSIFFTSSISSFSGFEEEIKE